MSSRKDKPSVFDAGRDELLTRELEVLKREYEALRTRAIENKRDLANEQQRLADLKQEALEAYGTSEAEELADLLEKRRAENQAAVTAYGEHVHSVRTELEALAAAEQDTSTP